MEILYAILQKNMIEGIDKNDLKELLLSEDKNYKNFTIKVVANDSILVYNKNINKNIRIKCVKNYYDLKETECVKIKDELDLFYADNCKVCHLNCLSKQK